MIRIRDEMLVSVDNVCVALYWRKKESLEEEAVSCKGGAQASVEKKHG